ncbi:UNVERIFIED_CONTAM: hypothetical protein HHA_275830 [Hammondia hammondi]|eukprot:XP_008888353.1 hypothetical protein HHA_275830 [Hammondia hammondi]
MRTPSAFSPSSPASPSFCYSLSPPRLSSTRAALFSRSYGVPPRFLPPQTEAFSPPSRFPPSSLSSALESASSAVTLVASRSASLLRSSLASSSFSLPPSPSGHSASPSGFTQLSFWLTPFSGACVLEFSFRLRSLLASAPLRLFGTAFLPPAVSPAAAAAEARVSPSLLSPPSSKTTPSRLPSSSLASSRSCPPSASPPFSSPAFISCSFSEHTVEAATEPFPLLPSPAVSGSDGASLSLERREGGTSFLPPDMLPDTRGLVYAIHHGEPLPLLAVRLCREQRVQELAANIAQRLLDALTEAEERRKGGTWEEERRASRAATRRGEEGNLKKLLDCSTFRRGERTRKQGLKTDAGNARNRDNGSPQERIRCYWPSVEDESSKMSVFFREMHATLYLLFEPRLFSPSPFLSSPLASSPSPFLSSFSGDREARGEGGERVLADRVHGESVFSLLNPHVMEMVVPSLKQGRRLHLLLAFLHCVESYFALHACSKKSLDPNRLLLAVGPARFLLLLSRLGFLPPSSSPSSSSSLSFSSSSVLGEHALPRELFGRLSAASVDALLLELLKNPGGNAFEAIKVVSLLRLLEQTESLDAPLKGSRWTLQAVAASVSSRKSESLLLAFLSSLAPAKEVSVRADAAGCSGVLGEDEIRRAEEEERGEKLALEACAWLARKAADTGEVADPWGYMVSRSFLLSRLRQQAQSPAALALDSAAHSSQEGREVEGWQHETAARRREELKGQGEEEAGEEEEKEVEDSEEQLKDEGCGKVVKRAWGWSPGSAAAHAVEESRRVCPLEKQGHKTYACAVHEERHPAEESEKDETDTEDLLRLPCLSDSAAAPASQSACFSTSWKLPPEVTPQTEEPPSSNEHAQLRSPSSSPSSPSSSPSSPSSSPSSPSSSPSSSSSSSPSSSSSSFRSLSLPWDVDRVLFLDTVEGLTGLFAFLRSSQEASCRVLSAEEAAGRSLPPQEALRRTASHAAGPAEAPAEEADVHSSPSLPFSTERDAALEENRRRNAKSGEEEKKREKKKNDAPVAGKVEMGKPTSSKLAKPCASQSRTRSQISSDAVLSGAEAASGTCGVSVSVLPALPSLVPFQPFVVAIDLEWTLPHAASVLSLATESRVFLVDLVNENPVYKATLLQMLRWLFANPFIAKLMYQASGDITKLFFALGAVGSPGALVHCIDLRHPRVWDPPASPEGANSLSAPAEARGPRVSPASDPSPKPGVSTAGNTRERREEAARTKEGAPGCRGKDAGAEEKEADAAEAGAEGFLVSVRKGLHLATAKRDLREGEIAKEHFSEKNEEETPESYTRPVKRRFPSLQEMCRQVLHADLDKSEQRSNWNLRPLTASQAHYAALDAYVLILLEAALRRQGWIPGNILGGLGEFSALSFRGRPSEFRIHYQKNASMQAAKVEAAEKRHFKWRGC